MKLKSMDNFGLTDQERNDIFYSLILPFIENGLSTNEKPKAFILGGQPAAGKSHFIKNILKRDKNVAIINGDDFRGYHPYYHCLLEENEENASDSVQKDINYWIEKAIYEISLKKYSMIIEGTMKNVNVPIKTAEFLKSRGYFVELNVILVNPEISKVDILKRYLVCKSILGVARFTKLQAHNETVNKIFENILLINDNENIDVFKLFRREIENYISLFEGGAAEVNSELGLNKILENEMNRKMSKNEREYLEESWRTVNKLSNDFSEVKSYLSEFKNEQSENYNFNGFIEKMKIR